MRKILSFISVVLWMMLIFNFSSAPAVESSKTSSKITNIGVLAVKKVKPSAKVDVKQVEHVVRKNAHFFIYSVLGILVLNLLIADSKVKRRILLAVIICCLYAISDEFHQMFVVGRSSQVTDIIIDTCGATLGIIVGNFTITSISRTRGTSASLDRYKTVQ